MGQKSADKREHSVRSIASHRINKTNSACKLAYRALLFCLSGGNEVSVLSAEPPTSSELCSRDAKDLLARCKRSVLEMHFLFNVHYTNCTNRTPKIW